MKKFFEEILHVPDLRDYSYEVRCSIEAGNCFKFQTLQVTNIDERTLLAVMEKTARVSRENGAPFLLLKLSNF